MRISRSQVLQDRLGYRAFGVNQQYRDGMFMVVHGTNEPVERRVATASARELPVP